MEQGYVKSIGTIHVQGGNVFIELESLIVKGGRTGWIFAPSMYSGGLVSLTTKRPGKVLSGLHPTL